MKNFMKRVLGALAILAALVANINAVSVEQVNKKVAEVIKKLNVSNVAGAAYGQQTNRRSDIKNLNDYAREYPQIATQLNSISKALESGSGRVRMQSAQPGGSASSAAQQITAILSGQAEPITKSEQKRQEQQEKEKIQNAQTSVVDLEKTTQQLKNAEKAAIDKPTDANQQKVEDIKGKIEESSAQAVENLETVRTWKGDLRGYTQREIDRAVNKLFNLYAREKDLTGKLDGITDKRYMRHTPQKDREQEHKSITEQLKKVRAEIRNQEAIAGITRSKIIRKGVWALGAAALIGAAVAADWYFEMGGMKAVRGGLNRVYEAMPVLPAWVPGTQANKRAAEAEMLSRAYAEHDIATDMQRQQNRGINTGLTGLSEVAEEQHRQEIRKAIGRQIDAAKVAQEARRVQALNEGLISVAEVAESQAAIEQLARDVNEKRLTAEQLSEKYNRVLGMLQRHEGQVIGNLPEAARSQAAAIQQLAREVNQKRLTGEQLAEKLNKRLGELAREQANVKAGLVGIGQAAETQMIYGHPADAFNMESTYPGEEGY